MVITHCLHEQCAPTAVSTGSPTSEDSPSPRQSKGFYAANGVSCSRKHTLLCSWEH